MPFDRVDGDVRMRAHERLEARHRLVELAGEHGQRDHLVPVGFEIHIGAEAQRRTLGGGDGFAVDEGGRFHKAYGARGFRGQLVEQRLGGATAQYPGMLVDGAQGRGQRLRLLDIVEADHRNVLRHAHAALARGRDEADGQAVIVGEHRVGGAFEVLRERALAAGHIHIEAAHGAGRQIVAVGGGADEAATRFARPGVRIAGQIGDRAVPGVLEALDRGVDRVARVGGDAGDAGDRAVDHHHRPRHHDALQIRLAHRGGEEHQPVGQARHPCDGLTARRMFAGGVEDEQAIAAFVERVAQMMQDARVEGIAAVGHHRADHAGGLQVGSARGAAHGEIAEPFGHLPHLELRFGREPPRFRQGARDGGWADAGLAGDVVYRHLRVGAGVGAGIAAIARAVSSVRILPRCRHRPLRSVSRSAACVANCCHIVIRFGNLRQLLQPPSRATAQWTCQRETPCSRQPVRANRGVRRGMSNTTHMEGL